MNSRSRGFGPGQGPGPDTARPASTAVGAGAAEGEDAGAAGDDHRELIRAAQAGDTQAFEALAVKHRERIFAVALRVVGNREEAKDVVQNVLVRLWRVLPKYDERFTFTTWLHRMTVNLAIDTLRRGAARLKETELSDAVLAPGPGAPAGRNGVSEGPELALRAVEVERIFAELAALLPPQQRAAFTLREIEGLSSDEVGAILGLSESTVRNHVFQARRTLREALARRYPEYLPPRRPSA